MKVNIIIVTYKRRKMLEECLRSLERAYAEARENFCDFKVFVGFNGDPEAYFHFKNGGHFSKIFSFSLIEEALTPAAARNYLLAKIEEAWVLFLDDDVALPETYFVEFLKIVNEYPEVQILGGPNINFTSATESERLQALVLGSWWGAGPFSPRYQKRPRHKSRNSSSLILCQLWIYKKLELELRFSPNLLCAEENELFSRQFRSENIEYFYFPDLFVYHHRRESLRQFFLQCIKFGKGRSQWISSKPYSKYLIGVIWAAAVIAIFCSLLWSFFCALLIAVFKRKLSSAVSIFKYCFSLQAGYFLGIILGYRIQPESRKSSLFSRTSIKSDPNHRDLVLESPIKTIATVGSRQK